MIGHKKTRRRENQQDVRREEILNAAIELSVKIGYQKITRELVAGAANVSHALVTFHFNNMEELKAAIMKAAIDREILPILAQGLSLGDKSINTDLKKKVIEYLTNH